MNNTNPLYDHSMKLGIALAAFEIQQEEMKYLKKCVDDIKITSVNKLTIESINQTLGRMMEYGQQTKERLEV